MTSTNVRSLAVNGSYIFAGTLGGGIFRSYNGAIWTAFNSGLTNFQIYSLVISGAYIFAGTNSNGAWRRDLLTSVQQLTSELPAAFTLDQNFPNPFNPSTNIHFALKERSKIKLVVYNMLGQLVATLVNEELNAGEYEARFEASTLSSGMYIYRLTANEFVQWRRMILLR